MKLVFVFVFTVNLMFGQVWLQLQDLPGLERDDGVAKVINNVAYFGTGLRVGYTLGNDFYALDLSLNTWTTISSMPTGSERQYAVAFTYSNYFFVHGGSGNGASLFSDTYRYNVSTDTWTTVAPKPGNAVMAAGSFTLNNMAYVFSGRFADNSVSDEVWEYDMIGDTWTQKNNFSFGGRWRSSAATLNNSGYVTFGMDKNGAYRKEIYRYNASSDSWTLLGNFPQANGRYYVGMQPAGNKLVLFGGVDTLNNFYNDCWFYDETNGFVQGPVLPSFGRKGGLCCSNGNNFYYSCGVTATVRVKETWMLDIVAGLDEIINDGLNFTIFPNPAEENINYELKINNMGGEFIFELNDISGRTIKQLQAKELRSMIDIGDLEAGIYFLKLIKDGNTIETKKIIKK